jgi:hypothetical protein
VLSGVGVERKLSSLREANRWDYHDPTPLDKAIGKPEIAVVGASMNFENVASHVTEFLVDCHQSFLGPQPTSATASANQGHVVGRKDRIWLDHPMKR